MKQVVNHVPEQEKEEAKAGIIAPQPVLLEYGSFIYRFANQVTSSFDYRAGPWWVGQEDFELMVARATRAKVDLGQKARWDLAVLHKWGSTMNVVIEAHVSARLWAWTGLAKPQQEVTPHGKVIRMFGCRDVKQLYLIGVVDPRVRVGADRGRILTTWGRQCLSITGAKLVPSSSLA
jgi:hypothetical protein